MAILLYSLKKALHVVEAFLSCAGCASLLLNFSFKETTSEFVAVVLIAASLYRASINRLASYTGDKTVLCLRNIMAAKLQKVVSLE